MSLWKFWVKQTEEEFDVDKILENLVPVGDPEKFSENHPEFKELSYAAWKSSLETRNESLQREVDRLKKYEKLVEDLLERLSHDDEFMRRFKRFIEANQPDMRVRKIEFKEK